jgi:hypothetical protein
MADEHESTLLPHTNRSCQSGHSVGNNNPHSWVLKCPTDRNSHGFGAAAIPLMGCGDVSPTI